MPRLQECPSCGKKECKASTYEERCSCGYSVNYSNSTGSFRDPIRVVRIEAREAKREAWELECIRQDLVRRGYVDDEY